MKTPTKNETNRRLPVKGWGPFRFEWYSICSGHGRNADGNYYTFDTSCDRCRAGYWKNCWMHEVESFVHDHNYPLWYWWANRPNLTTAAKELWISLKMKMR